MSPAQGIVTRPPGGSNIDISSWLRSGPISTIFFYAVLFLAHRGMTGFMCARNGQGLSGVFEFIQFMELGFFGPGHVVVTCSSASVMYAPSGGSGRGNWRTGMFLESYCIAPGIALSEQSCVQAIQSCSHSCPSQGRDLGYPLSPSKGSALFGGLTLLTPLVHRLTWA
eukprot:1160614-Pelagomonas_calceolata.AAC.7